MILQSEKPEIKEQDRSRLIGGSDIAAVMGLSRWKTCLALWAEKTGKIQDDPLSNFEQKEIGVELEEYIARKFTQKTGIKLRRDSRCFKHPKYDYMIAHVDRWVVGEDSVFEAKNTSAWMAKDWEGEGIPQEYVLQVMWYLGILGKSKGYIAVLIGGNKFIWKEIRFDRELFDRMVESARVFMEEFVLADVAPMATAGDQETLSLLYPESKPGTIFFDGDKASEIDNLIATRNAHLRNMSGIKEELDSIEAKIKQHLGESESGETDGFYFSWKTQSRTSVDMERLKQDGLFDQYSKVSSFRVLKTKRKGV